jgi:hypothetical protein
VYNSLFIWPHTRRGAPLPHLFLRPRLARGGAATTDRAVTTLPLGCGCRRAIGRGSRRARAQRIMLKLTQSLGQPCEFYLCGRELRGSSRLLLCGQYCQSHVLQTVCQLMWALGSRSDSSTGRMMQWGIRPAAPSVWLWRTSTNVTTDHNHSCAENALCEHLVNSRGSRQGTRTYNSEGTEAMRDAYTECIPTAPLCDTTMGVPCTAFFEGFSSDTWCGGNGCDGYGWCDTQAPPEGDCLEPFLVQAGVDG